LLISPHAYSYLMAWDGLILLALQAGCNAKITLMPMPNARAPISTVGVKIGVMVNPPVVCT